MAAFVALLGAVNVGGRNKISMADLRGIVDERRPHQREHLHPERQRRSSRARSARQRKIESSIAEAHRRRGRLGHRGLRAQCEGPRANDRRQSVRQSQAGADQADRGLPRRNRRRSAPSTSRSTDPRKSSSTGASCSSTIRTGRVGRSSRARCWPARSGSLAPRATGTPSTSCSNWPKGCNPRPGLRRRLRPLTM